LILRFGGARIAMIPEVRQPEDQRIVSVSVSVSASAAAAAAATLPTVEETLPLRNILRDRFGMDDLRSVAVAVVGLPLRPLS